MWQVIQECTWTIDGKPYSPKPEVVFTSKYWVSAVLWKFFHYDFPAEPIWKASFPWKIQRLDAVPIAWRTFHFVDGCKKTLK